MVVELQSGLNLSFQFGWYIFSHKRCDTLTHFVTVTPVVCAGNGCRAQQVAIEIEVEQLEWGILRGMAGIVIDKGIHRRRRAAPFRFKCGEDKVIERMVSWIFGYCFLKGALHFF